MIVLCLLLSKMVGTVKFLRQIPSSTSYILGRNVVTQNEDTR